jgi:hypothetical protein
MEETAVISARMKPVVFGYPFNSLYWHQEHGKTVSILFVSTQMAAQG